MEFIQQLTSPESAKEYTALMHLFTRLKNNISPIWPFIKESVTQKLLIEVGASFRDSKDWNS